MLAGIYMQPPVVASTNAARPSEIKALRPIPGGLHLDEAPVSLLIVTPLVPVTNWSSSFSARNHSGDRYPCLS